MSVSAICKYIAEKWQEGRQPLPAGSKGRKEIIMKKMNKFAALLLAFIMMLALGAPSTAFAEGTAHETKVKIHKIYMPKETYDAFKEKTHDGSEITNLTDYFGTGAKAINGVAFRVYQILEKAETGALKGDAESLKPYGSFDAGKYYKLVQVAGKDFVLTAKSDETDGVAEVTLPDGKYYVVEDKANSTYNDTNLTGMKAVPFVLELPAGLPDGSGNYGVDNPLHVYPKNTDDKVKFDKNFAREHGLEAIKDPNTLKDVGAVVENYKTQKATLSARIGQKVPYESVAEMPLGTIFRQMHLSDIFEKGMKYDKGSMVVTWNEKGKTAKANPLTAVTDYTIEESEVGFDISFTEAGLKKLNEAAKSANIQVWFNYNGEVTEDALIDKSIDNNITLEFNHEKPTPEPVKPSNGEVKVEKTWADGQAPSGVKVKYVLKEGKDKVVGAVTLPAGNTNPIDLGDGVTFVPSSADSLGGSFKGLDNEKKYTVVEFVDGYSPAYKAEAGKVTVTNTKTPTSITPTPPSVETHGKRFVKTNDKTGEEQKRLNNAQFVIKKEGTNKQGATVTQYLTLKDGATEVADKESYDAAEKAYQEAIDRLNTLLGKTEELTAAEKEEKTKLEGAESVSGSIQALKKARDAAYEKVHEVWDWTETKDNAYKFTSDKNGQFEVKGLRKLPDGKVYTVEEVKAPNGYVLPSNAAEIAKFTVGEGSYNEQPDGIEYKLDMTGVTNPTALRIENTLVTIPKTGGMGTTLFIVAGIGLMAAAVVFFIKNRKEEMAA